jgi:hypothetical protein
MTFDDAMQFIKDYAKDKASLTLHQQMDLAMKAQQVGELEEIRRRLSSISSEIEQLKSKI